MPLTSSMEDYLEAVLVIQQQKGYEKHQFFTRQLVEAGVPQDIAAQDACKLEHVISEISFKKLKEAVWINDREVIPSEKPSTYKLLAQENVYCNNK